MNRKNLTSAVVAGLAGVAGISATAQAMNLNPDGLGQVLLYPYYTTRNGNTTLLSVVNTTDQAKAVKVRFMEGKNTREVLDFNLYMSPFDVWTAALLDGGVVDTNCDIVPENFPFAVENGMCGVPHLLTSDSTCTVPYLFESASTGAGLQTFLPFRLDDDGGDDIDRAAEGHFEMIEMGTLVDGDLTPKTGDGNGSAMAATHGSDGMPADCQQLVDAWTTGGTLPGGGPAPDGYWIDDPSTEIEAPSGGLFGGAAIINVAEGYMFSYDAKAVNNFQSDAVPDALTTLHAVPGTVDPGLNSGDVLEATIFLDDGTTATFTAATDRGVDALSFLFMHDQLLNEYTVETSVNAGTEWVITFPTKHFYVFDDDTAPLVAPVAPFTTAWEALTDSDDEVIDGSATACESVLISNIYDREEQTTITPGTPGGPPIVSPAPPVPPPPGVELFELCYETNVIEFVAGGASVEPPVEGGGTAIFGALNATTFTLPEGFQAGWASLELQDYISDAGTAAERVPLGGAADGNASGLPVIGFAAQKFGNNNASSGIAAFYGGIYNHKGTRSISGVTGVTP